MTFDIGRIWSDICGGDATAWRQLVHAYASLVFTVARRAGLSVTDAEDCAQQTWLALFRNRRSIVDPVSLPAWLIKTTHRKALTIRQRASRSQSVDLSESLHDQKALPDELVASLEESAVVELAVRLLDPRCRRVVTELYLSAESTTYADLAKALRIRPNSLGPLRSRCLDKLRKILKNLGYETD